MAWCVIKLDSGSFVKFKQTRLEGGLSSFVLWLALGIQIALWGQKVQLKCESEKSM